MAEESVSTGRKPARVTRNHLSESVHTSAGSAETGTGAASAFASGGSAARGTPVIADITVVKSSMPSPSGKGLRRSRTAPFPGIGRAIC